MIWKKEIERVVSELSGKELSIADIRPVGGGSINEAYLLKTNDQSFFIKVNHAGRYPDMFAKEAIGLGVLARAKSIAVPGVIATGKVENWAYLLLPYIESAAMKPAFWRLFGEQLANLHRHTRPDFGLDHHNYIGSLVQTNNPHPSWTEFFIAERLEPQIKMARNSGKLGSSAVQAFQRFYNHLDDIFPNEPPALLHGDLWSGNYMVGHSGEPVLIDPAVYYGHREMDLAMTTLFGGFSPSFYEAYHEYYPLENGWQKRLDFCNLYPLLVHVNLFGGGYVESVKAILAPF